MIAPPIRVTELVTRAGALRVREALRTTDPTLPLILPYDSFGYEYDGDLFTTTTNEGNA